MDKFDNDEADDVIVMLDDNVVDWDDCIAVWVEIILVVRLDKIGSASRTGSFEFFDIPAGGTEGGKTVLGSTGGGTPIIKFTLAT